MQAANVALRHHLRVTDDVDFSRWLEKKNVDRSQTFQHGVCIRFSKYVQHGQNVIIQYRPFHIQMMTQHISSKLKEQVSRKCLLPIFIPKLSQCSRCSQTSGYERLVFILLSCRLSPSLSFVSVRGYFPVHGQKNGVHTSRVLLC